MIRIKKAPEFLTLPDTDPVDGSMFCTTDMLVWLLHRTESKGEWLYWWGFFRALDALCRSQWSALVKQARTV